MTLEEDLLRLVQTHVPVQPHGYHGTQPEPVQLVFNCNEGAVRWTVKFVVRLQGTRRKWGWADGRTLAAALERARRMQEAAQ